MNFRNLFKNEHDVLKNLPERPKVFWYLSAEKDFRGPVFLTDHNILREKTHYNHNFEKPDLFVYNSIGKSIETIKEKFKADEPILFEDEKTKIIGRNLQELPLADDYEIFINPSRIRYADKSCYENIDRAYYFEVEIIGETYKEVQRIIYFIHENIDFYEKVMRKNYFQTIYLCATRQGSNACILEHLKRARVFDQYQKQNFKPKYIIAFTGRLNRVLSPVLSENPSVSVEYDYGNYIQEGRQIFCKNYHPTYFEIIKLNPNHLKT